MEKATKLAAGDLFACSGGARMKRIVSLMQMAKTSAALKNTVMRGFARERGNLTDHA